MQRFYSEALQDERILPKIEGDFEPKIESEMRLFLPTPDVKMVFSSMKNKQELEKVLQSASEVMFPHLENHEIDVASVASDGDTPVHIATVWGDKYAVELLLDAGAAIDVLGDMSATPLYNAVGQEHIEVAELLLSRGANPDIMSDLGYSPRTLANSKGGNLSKLFDKYAA